MDKEKCIQILQDAIKINTENGNEKELALYYQNLLKEAGIQSKLIDYDEKRASLIAEIENGGEGKTLGLTGHLDVVSAGKEEDWTHPPFEGHIENDVIWGRGASDMKGGVSALVVAFIMANERKNFSGKVKLILTVGEEIGQLGAGQLSEEGEISDIDSIIIGEPCNVGVAYAHMGSLNYKVVSKGITSHSSTPENGSNAIEHLLDAMSEIKEKIAKESDQYENKILGKTFNNITVCSGGSQVNSIPDYAEFEANARTIPEFDNAALMEMVIEIVNTLNKKDGYDLSVEVTADLLPVETNPESDLIKTLVDAANKHEELKPSKLLKDMDRETNGSLKKMLANEEFMKAFEKVRPMVIAGTTDAAQFIKRKSDLNIAVYGPGLPLLNHKTDERLDLNQYLSFIKVYTETIEKYLADK